MDYPVDNQTGIALNKALTYTFSEAIDPESIFSGSVVLFEADTNQEVDGTYSYDADTFQVSFLSDTTLNPYTTYMWFFTGADTLDALPVELANGDPLLETISIGFQTGDALISSVPEGDSVAIPIDEFDTIDDGQTEDERAADVFRIDKTIPEIYQSFVDVSTNTVTIEFNSPVKTGQDLDSLITLSYDPLLRETYYFKGKEFNAVTTVQIPGAPAPVEGTETFQMPNGSWTLSNADRTLTWTKTEAWNANAYVRVKVSKDLLDANDLKLNDNQDEEFYFLTQVFPLFSTVESTLLPLSAIPGVVSEEVVIKYILKNSLDAWYYANRCFNIVTPHRAAIRYVECATVVAILDMKSIVSELSRGKSINLSDLGIENKFPRSTGSASSVTSTIRSECAKKMWEAKKELSVISKNYEFQIGTKGLNTSLVHDVFRNRQSQFGDLGVTYPR